MNWIPQSQRADPERGTNNITRIVVALVGAYLVGCAVLWWWWDYEPDTFAVSEVAAKRAEAHNHTIMHDSWECFLQADPVYPCTQQ